MIFWACSFRILAKCPPFLPHSISAWFHGSFASSTAVTQNCFKVTQPKPQLPTISSMGDAWYCIRSPRAPPLELRTLTFKTIRLVLETTSIWRSTSPGFVQWDHVLSPSISWVRRPSHWVEDVESWGNGSVAGVPGMWDRGNDIKVSTEWGWSGMLGFNSGLEIGRNWKIFRLWRYKLNEFFLFSKRFHEMIIALSRSIYSVLTSRILPFPSVLKKYISYYLFWL